jgi:hypothetical protein
MSALNRVKFFSIIFLFLGAHYPVLSSDLAETPGPRLHDNDHGASRFHSHQHDDVNMPGLRGKDTTAQEVSDLRRIFVLHKGIDRKVINLADGIKTTTQAKDPQLRESVLSHVAMMVTRLAEGKNPEILIQSPTLDQLFKFHKEIRTELMPTDWGITVIQTSSNPKVVELLQKHAAEVSEMARRGMAAVHERMEKSR